LKEGVRTDSFSRSAGTVERCSTLIQEVTMIAHVLARPTAWSLMLGALALVATASVVGRPADARAGVHATGVSETSVTLSVRSTRFGRILFDGRGRALYAFSRDRRGGHSRCYGACAKAWPVYSAKGRLLAGKGVRQSLLGTSRRRDGRRQVTYNRRPLYYYVGDRKPGQVLCQNVDEFGGTWLVVRPSGQLVR
jgi:predicted lipoprotein with Yx(FWY)xxD motif